MTEESQMEVLPADRNVEEVTSFCVNCSSENGQTRLLLTRIPYFRDIVIMSFSCPDCHFQNNEIQNAGQIQQRGVRFEFKGETPEDLQRQVVKGDHCTVRYEQLDLEIPAGKGRLTNMQGLFHSVLSDLALFQAERRQAAPEVAAKLEGVLHDLQKVVDGESFPFTITMEDPTGNSTIEPSPSDKPGKYVRSEFARTKEQNTALGLGSGTDEEAADGSTAPPSSTVRPEYRARTLYPAPPPTDGLLNQDRMEGDLDENGNLIEKEVYELEDHCPGCSRPCRQNMQMLNIPHFDEIIIMATTCEHCGYKNSEIKYGGAIPDRGRRLTLAVKTKEDLSRDILKSNHCAVTCPEIGLHVQPGTQGGRFTTVEGLLSQMRDDLKKSVYDIDDYGNVQASDSMPQEQQRNWSQFFTQIDAAIDGALQFTLVLQDPLAMSYVQSFTAPDPDEQITVEDYDRTWEEDEDLGLHDMQTEGYEGDPNKGKDAGDVGEAGEGEGKMEQIIHGQEKLEPQPVDLDEVQREVKERLLRLDEEGVGDGTGS